MSGTTPTTWNPRQVDLFKKAFGDRGKLRSPTSSEPTYNPAASYERAKEMLANRRSAATQTSAQVLARQQPVLGAENSMLIGLLAMQTELAARSVLGADPGPDEDFGPATQRLISLTDEWIVFEARCISANNEMTAGENDAGVRAKLALRAAGLAAALAGFRTAKEPPDLRALQPKVEGLVEQSAGAGAHIADTAAFAAAIEECTKLVRAAGDEVSDSLQSDVSRHTLTMSDEGYQKWVEIQELQLKELYGIEAKTTPIRGLQPGPFPYKDLLDVLAMVPTDHSMTNALKTVTREYVAFSDGGDYSEAAKTIRINPVVEWTSVLDRLPARKLPGIGDGGVYKDPASGANMRLNAWKATALHEIGHAVDAAYGVMKKHQAKVGCGTWTKHDPTDFLPQYAVFLASLRASPVPDPAYVANTGHAKLKPIFCAFALRTKTLDQTRVALSAFWTNVHTLNDANRFEARYTAANDAMNRIWEQLRTTFPDGRAAGDPAALRRIFESPSVSGGDLNIVLNVARALSEVEFWARFATLALTPASSWTTLKNWMGIRQIAFRKVVDSAKEVDRAAKVAIWVGATVAAFPPLDPTSLARYRAAAEPWNRDISNEMIGDVRAAQEAYKGDEHWWRYSGSDRGGTFVSTYQWRAPGEWFAELYAVTWLKKVEPPAGVGKDVRPYLFGGSITPDAPA